MDLDESWRMARVLAHLLRNEGVPAEVVERAVESAVEMKPGEMASLTGEGPPGTPATMRRAFVQELVGRLESS